MKRCLGTITNAMEFYYDDVDADVLVVIVDGGLNADTAAQFMASVSGLVEAGIQKLIVDCSKLDYISSFGLSQLILLHGRMKKQDGDVKLCNIRGIVPQVLATTKLDKLFDIYDDVSAARLAFRPVG
ncbi:MAG: STAS domain-containing protein [Planctomycetota bacterium]|nr:STAS domain-containing protein [Planctomycetota bacterium]